MIRMKRAMILGLGLLLCAGVLAATPGTASAGSDTYEDAERGWKVKYDDDLNQVPPKLTDDESYKLASWYVDKAKYAGSMKPTFEIVWFPTPKKGAVTGGGKDEKEDKGQGDSPFGDGIEMPPGMADMWGRPKNTDKLVERMLRLNERMFGPFKELDEHRKDKKAVDTIKTKSKHECQIVELNHRKPKRGEEEYPIYLMVGKLTLDRPADTVEVGFVGYCPVSEMKKWSKKFKSIIKSFDELEDATNTRNLGDKDIHTLTPEEFRARVKKKKVIDGWKALDTENYLILYNEEVDRGLVKRVATEIEAIREQVYEVLFPPDKEITEVSVVRVCKDKDEYHAYGGPGGSAGYWAAFEKELVFYEDSSSEKNAMAVLYHEAFHQYIYYSVGDMAPHSWFNEGHGDYFAGHVYKSGKFRPEEFRWRTGQAQKGKREWKLDLKDWLGWTQGQYYGGNEYRIPGGMNYALGWSFIWFLRTTKNEEYQKILPRYFNSLKTSVTKHREAMEKWEKQREGEDGEGGAPEPFDPEGMTPEELRERMESMGPPRANNREWLEKALEEGFKGIDMTELQEEWLDY